MSDAKVIDLEVERSLRIVEALGPANYTGARLSEDGAKVVLEVGSGELQPGAAETLGLRLLELAKVAREAGKWASGQRWCAGRVPSWNEAMRTRARWPSPWPYSVTFTFLLCVNDSSSSNASSRALPDCLVPPKLVPVKCGPALLIQT